MLSLAFVLSACSSSNSGPALQVSQNPEADLSGFRTFDFTGDGNVEGLEEEVLNIMGEAVAQALIDKGYQRSSSNPDFLVEGFGSFEGRMEEEEIKQRYPSYFQRENEHTFTRTTTVVTNWEEGTLAIHVLDGESGTLVWSVTAEGAIEMSGNMDVMRERMATGAANVLADFPAR
jgi:hypothetical protein